MKKYEKIPITVILGPTASGKTSYAIYLAKKTNSVVINADSRQIYKDLNIGTAKPNLSFENGSVFVDNVEHFGFNLINIFNNFSAMDFSNYFHECVEKILKLKKNIILTGGTGFYISACLFNFAKIPEIPITIREKVRNIIKEKGKIFALKFLRTMDNETEFDENNPVKISRALEVVLYTKKTLKFWQEKTNIEETNFDINFLALDVEREELYDRINKRFDLMLEKGLLNEAEFLNKQGFSDEKISSFGIGYSDMIDFLNKKISLLDAKALAKQKTRNYAKRQLTWIRRYKNISWIKN